MRLPIPYRPEAEIVARHLACLFGQGPRELIEMGGQVPVLKPALDLRNRTAELAVDLIESLFGKSTLMRKSSEKP